MARVVQLVVARAVQLVVARVVLGLDINNNLLGIIFCSISSSFSSSVMVTLRVVSRKRLRFNRYQPCSAIAYLLLNRRAKDFTQAVLTNRTISNAAFFRLDPLLLLLTLFYMHRFFSLLSPSCHNAVPYRNPIQTHHA